MAPAVPSVSPVRAGNAPDEGDVVAAEAEAEAEAVAQCGQRPWGRAARLFPDDVEGDGGVEVLKVANGHTAPSRRARVVMTVSIVPTAPRVCGL